MDTPLFFHNINDFSGSTRVLATVLTEEFASCEVTVICRTLSSGGFLDNLPGVTVVSDYVRPTIRGHRIIVVSEIIYRLSQFYLALKYGHKHKAFYINTIVPFMAAIAGKMAGKSIIYHVHEKPIQGNRTAKFADFVFRKIHSYRIFVSKYTKSCYPENGSQSEVRYNRLSKDFLNGCEPVIPEMHKRDTVIMLASINPAKGIDTFIQLAEFLPQYKFILVGSCIGNPPTFENKSANLSCYFNVRNVHPYLKKSDILLNLSNHNICIETFGMTIIEGFAYGLPAIVPFVGGPTEIVIDGEQGFCLDVTNTKLVASKIVFLLNNKEKYIQFSCAATSRANFFL